MSSINNRESLPDDERCHDSEKLRSDPGELRNAGKVGRNMSFRDILKQMANNRNAFDLVWSDEDWESLDSWEQHERSHMRINKQFVEQFGAILSSWSQSMEENLNLGGEFIEMNEEMLQNLGISSSRLDDFKEDIVSIVYKSIELFSVDKDALTFNVLQKTEQDRKDLYKLLHQNIKQCASHDIFVKCRNELPKWSATLGFRGIIEFLKNIARDNNLIDESERWKLGKDSKSNLGGSYTEKLKAKKNPDKDTDRHFVVVDNRYDESATTNQKQIENFYIQAALQFGCILENIVKKDR